MLNSWCTSSSSDGTSYAELRELPWKLYFNVFILTFVCNLLNSLCTSISSNGTLYSELRELPWKLYFNDFVLTFVCYLFNSWGISSWSDGTSFAEFVETSVKAVFLFIYIKYCLLFIKHFIYGQFWRYFVPVFCCIVLYFDVFILRFVCYLLNSWCTSSSSDCTSCTNFRELPRNLYFDCLLFVKKLMYGRSFRLTWILFF